jgi:hypothetical protein
MKKTQRKRRFIGVEFTLGEIPKEELDTLRIGAGFIDDKFQIRIKTDKQKIQTNGVKGFLRESKPGFNLKKVYHKSNSGSLEPTAYLEGIERVFAIDTNQRKMLGNTYSVGVVSGVQVKPNDKGLLDIEAKVIDYLPQIGRQEKLENKNWKLFIENYLSVPENRKVSTGIIVDSDLGSIDKYNSKSLPIYENYFLPENIELIYASADTKNDTIINKLISFSDEESTKYLNELEMELVKTMEKLRVDLIGKNPTLVEEVNAFFDKRL